MGRSITRAEAAELAGVKPNTWASYVARGQAPKPARFSYDKPLWDESIVLEWKENRPGRGSRSTPRAQERAKLRATETS